MTDALRLLVVEDSPGDALLITEQLADSSLGEFEVEHVGNFAGQCARDDGITFAGKRTGAAFQP